MFGRFGTSGVDVTGEAWVAVDVAQHKAALEAQLAGVPLGEACRDRHQGEVACHQISWLVELLDDVLKLKLIANAQYRHQPMIRCASRSSSSTLTRTPQIESIGP